MESVPERFGVSGTAVARGSRGCTRSVLLTSGLLIGALALGACNAWDEPLEHDPSLPLTLVPVDTRAPARAATPPPPISGGTLAVVAGGALAVAADPARDRVSVVDVGSMSLRHTIELRKGDEPGRLAEDGQGRVHVALRRAGELVSLDPSTGKVLERRDVCASPRGVAYDPSVDRVLVACSEGKLVSLPPTSDGSNAMPPSEVARDVRDIVVVPPGPMRPAGGLYVSRFKAAELLELGAEGVTVSRRRPGKHKATVPHGHVGHPQRERDFQPNAAWRTVALGSGDILMLHQQAQVTEIDLEPEQQSGFPGSSTSPYGGGDPHSPGCGGIVRSVLTVFDGQQGRSRSVALRATTMAVDVAGSPDGNWIAVAVAGEKDRDQPKPRTVFPDNGGDAFPMIGPARAPGPRGGGFVVGGGLLMLPAPGLTGGHGSGFPDCASGSGPHLAAQAVAVAFSPDSRRLLVQSREPAALHAFDVLTRDPGGFLRLGGKSIADTGHDLFHRDTGQGIACASCHLEGSEDGHTWRFSGIGARRTQALDVGLAGTAPFHWDGDMGGLDVLMGEVFVHRMGGVWQSPERLDTLQGWLFSLEPRKAPRAASEPAVKRGKALFHSPAVGCASCHQGAALTASGSHDVGTGRPGQRFQVPSLRGLAYRAPYMHDGCAPTLADRFTPACGGGDMHGRTFHLKQAELDDLVAYLESL